jgi:biopolymer transport protein ExbB
VLKIWQIWESGGWVMIPLFVLAVLLYSQAFQLVMYVRRTNLSGRGEASWWEWVRFPDKAEGRVAEIIEYTQSDVWSAKQIRNRFDEVRIGLISLIDRRTRFLGTLVAAAPLLGLLGTVLGMLQTFFGISTSGGAETAGVVASGVSEALVTTQTGLTIALPGLFLVMMIQRQRHGLEAKLARLESLTLSHFKFE